MKRLGIPASAALSGFAVAALLLTPLTASANAILNGGFETCIAGNAAFWTEAAGNTANINCVTSPTVSGAPAVSPYEGTYMEEIKTEGDGAISQLFSPTAGSYAISYAYNLSSFDFLTGAHGADYFLVLLDGVLLTPAVLIDDAPDSVWSNTGWLTNTVATSLSAGAHTLAFCIDTSDATTGTVCAGQNLGTTNPTLLAYIDAVDVEAVPEPASMTLLGTGLIWGVRKLKKRKQLAAA
jgi:hypothetical protein